MSDMYTPFRILMWFGIICSVLGAIALCGGAVWCIAYVVKMLGG